MTDNLELEEKLRAKEDFGWFSLAFGIFVLLVVIFNSKSFVNYAATLDISGGGANIKQFSKSWHQLMSDIGFDGPRRMIEDLKTKPKEDPNPNRLQNKK